VALAARHIVVQAADSDPINSNNTSIIDKDSADGNKTTTKTTSYSATRLENKVSNDDDDDDDSFWSLVEAIWDQSSALEQLWRVHESWLGRSASSAPIATTTTPMSTTKTTAIVDIRYHCRRAVLEDWKQLLHNYRHCSNRQQQPCDWDNLCRLEWCRQLNGVVVPWHAIHKDDPNDIDVDDISMKDHHARKLEGGIHQTLSSTSSLLSSIGKKGGNLEDGGTRHVLSILETARELIAVDRATSNADSSQNTDHSSQLRALLRSILAWLGQSRKNLDLLLLQAKSNNSNDHKAVPLLLKRVAEMLHAADEHVVVLVLALMYVKRAFISFLLKE
jgi:hypothetical protein